MLLRFKMVNHSLLLEIFSCLGVYQVFWCFLFLFLFCFVVLFCFGKNEVSPIETEVGMRSLNHVP